MEDPPEADALRWGPSVIVRPDDRAMYQLQDWTDGVMEIAGTTHWSTGSREAAHITVRTLAARRSDGLDPSVPDRWAAAVARSVGPNRLSFAAERMLVTPISVMLGLRPTDDEPDRLARSLASELGEDGWFEKDRVRDIWYVNLVHFTGPVAEPARLVDWAEGCHVDSSFIVHGRSLDVVRWRFDGARMTPDILAEVRLP